MISNENLVESFNQKDFQVIFIVGPTGAGKSKLALNLVKKWGGSIVNADSIQFYNSLKIGSASPTVDDQNQANHFLYNYIPDNEVMTAGQFQRDFYKLLKEKKIQNPLYVVGGTGFYIQALEKGMFDVPEVPQSIKLEILDEMSAQTQNKLYKELIEFDPDCVIHPNDSYRIGRALELKRAFNIRISSLNKISGNYKNSLPFNFMKVGVDFIHQTELDKKNYREQIQNRCYKMLQMGILEEVSDQLRLNHHNWSALNSVGYFEIKKFLLNELSWAEVLPAMTLSTIQLIKKQRTWFKKDIHTNWIYNYEKASVNHNKIFDAIQDFLNR